MKVRFYMNALDVVGKIIDVKSITFHNTNRYVKTMSGEVFDCPENFVLMEQTKVKLSRYTADVIIEAAD